MSEFKAQDLSIYVNSKPLFKKLSFEIGPGEVFAIMGGSGSGKSSLLSYIVGSLSSDLKGSGKLYLNGKQIESLDILDRKVGILLQDDLLFPHMSVGENLLFAMTDAADKKTRKNLVELSLKKSGLDGFFKRKPATLSGGQRARVGALRTLLSKPKLILLDEPFSKLDKSLRSSFRNFIFTEIENQKIPCILVTHDSDDIPANAKTIVIDGTEISRI